MLDIPLDSYFENLITNIVAVLAPEDVSYRDNNNKLIIDTSIITKAGSRKCGKEFVKTPIIKNKRANVIAVQSNSTCNNLSSNNNISDLLR